MACDIRAFPRVIMHTSWNLTMNQQQGSTKPSIPSRRRALLDSNPPAYTFPSIGVDAPSPSSNTCSYLPNPWDHPHNRARSRVRSMNEPPYHHSETSSFAPTTDLGASVQFPEPQLLQPSISDSSSLHVPPRNLYHRHSKSDPRLQARVSIPRGRGDSNISFRPTPSHQGTDESEHHPEVR